MLMVAVQQQRAGNAATSKSCCAGSHPADRRMIVPNGIRTPVRLLSELPIRGNHNSAFLSTSSGVSHVSAAPRYMQLLLRE